MNIIESDGNFLQKDGTNLTQSKLESLIKKLKEKYNELKETFSTLLKHKKFVNKYKTTKKYLFSNKLSILNEIEKYFEATYKILYASILNYDPSKDGDISILSSSIPCS